MLTDDRDNPDLLVFEKTWGHRLLAGFSVAMLIGGGVVCLYCIFALVNIASAVGTEALVATFGFALYTAVLVGSVAVIPPALLGIYVAKHPRHTFACIAAAIVAFVLVAVFVVVGLGLPGAQPFSVALYAVVAAVPPLVYLIAAIKVRQSTKTSQEVQ